MTDPSLRSLIADSGDLSVRISLEGELEWVASNADQILGSSARALVGRRLGDLVHPDDRAAYAAVPVDPVNGRSLEARFRRPDGTSRWLWEIRAPVLDAQGRTVAWSAVLRDVDAVHRTRMELARGRAELATAQQLAHVGSWVWDPAVDSVTWTDELFRIFGLDVAPEAPSFAAHKAMFTDETRPTLVEAVARLTESGEPYEVALDVRRPDGEIRHVIARGEAVLSPDGAIARLQGALTDVTELRRTEAALRASEARFAGVFHAISESISILRPIRSPDGELVDHEIRWVLAAWLRRYGADGRQPIGRRVFELFPNFAHLRDMHARVLATGAPERRVERLPDGRWLDIDFVPFGTDLLAVARDITVERDALDALEASRAALAQGEQRLRLIVEQTDDVIFQSSDQAVLSWVSPSVERLLGWTPSELVGRPVFEIIERGDRETAGARSEGVNAGSTASYEARFLCKDGTHRLLWVVASALRDADGRIIGRTGVARDVEAAARAREALEEARLELAEAQRIAGVGSWVRDPLTGSIAMSDELYWILGLDRATTHPSIEAVEPLLAREDFARLRLGIEPVLATGDPWEAEFELHRPDGAARHVLIHVEAGHVRGALRGTVTDLTDALARREARARRIARRADYLARAEHALRTNISVVEGWAEMLADEKAMDSTLRQRGMTVIARNAHLLAQELRDLMSEAAEAARADALELAPVDVAAIAASVVADYEGLPDAGGLTCRPLAGVIALGAPDALDKVVRHLVENAVRHSPGGTIEVRIRRSASDAVQLRVADDGPGLPTDVDVFAAFAARGPAAGTGLGLHVVRTLVEAMNGSVVGNDRVDRRGAEFVVTLQATDRAPL